MIAKVATKRRNGVRVLGSKPVGLVRYLFGRGRYNEHTDQRVIAASETLGVADGTRLDYRMQGEEIRELGVQLDAYRKALGVEVPRGFLWHCAISLPPQDSTAERRLSDGQWAEVVRETVKRLGFDGGDEASCRWLAVHHGQSIQGNEHVHLIVNVVREDGTIASLSNDFHALSAMCREMEARYGLTVVAGRATAEHERAGQRGVSRAQLERAAREGKPEPDQVRLERIVRAALAAAEDEAEFVDRLRGLGVLARPRYGKGGQEVVGYSVALEPDAGRDPVWFGGGRLHADLTLPKLREGHWPESAQAMDSSIGDGGGKAGMRALAAWASASERVGKTLPRTAYGYETWRQAAQALGAVREELADVPEEDIETWAEASWDVGCLLALWSERIEGGVPGALAFASDHYAQRARILRAVVDSPSFEDRERRPRYTGRLAVQGIAKVLDRPLPVGRRYSAALRMLRQVLELIYLIECAELARVQAEAAVKRTAAISAKLAALEQRWSREERRQSSSSRRLSIAQPTRNNPGFGI